MEKPINIIELSSMLNGKKHNTESREALNLLRSMYQPTGLPRTITGKPVFTVLFIASGGSEEKFLQIADSLPRPVVVVSDSFNNSLPAALEISTWLFQNKIMFEHIYIPAIPSAADKEEIVHKLAELETIQCGLSAISHYRIALIGGESPWLISSGTDKANLQERYGVTFIETETTEIAEAFYKESCVDPESQALIQKLAPYADSLVCGNSLEEAVKFYKVLKKYIQDNKIDALTIKCFDFLTNCKTTACLALAILNDEGTICGCEGDIPSLWSMILAKEICNSISFMANPSSVEFIDKSVDFAHCTAPMSIGTHNQLTTHYESGEGVGVASQIKTGKYTLFKCGGSNLDLFYCFKGELVQNTSVKERCRTQVKFVFKHREELDCYMLSYLGNHAILLPGNHKRILDKFADMTTFHKRLNLNKHE
jgi:L-fucose isomerase-like protein